MSKVIDERVVEMRFDNKQFEKATAESRESMAKLKNSLNDLDHLKTFESMNQAAKNVKLDSIADSLSFLERRFSLFGELVHGSIQKVASSIITTIKKPIAFIEDAIVQGGKRRATNLENAHFQLQALLGDEVLVQDVMKNASNSVTDTAYALDEAAKAASMFAASGIKAGDDMEKALKAVVGVAATTNSEYQGIAQIFTTVAGNGRLMGDQLLQLSTRGLNSAAILAEYFNEVASGQRDANASIQATVKQLSAGLKVSEGDIRDWVSKGKISFDIFTDAMYQNFSDAAFRANETVNGAFSNIKAALAKIGAEFYGPLIEQNSTIVVLLNDVRKAINKVKDALIFTEEKNGMRSMAVMFTQSVLEMAASVSDFINKLDFTKPVTVLYGVFFALENSIRAVISVLKPLSAALANVFGKTFGQTVVDITVQIVKFTNAMIMSDESAGKFQEAIEGVLKLGKALIDLLARMVKAIIPVNDPVKTLSGLFFDLLSIIGKVTSAAADWINSSEGISKSMDSLKSVMGKAGEVILTVVGAIIQFVDQIDPIDKMRVAIDNLTSGFKKFGEIVSPYIKDAANKIFDFGKAVGTITAGGVLIGIEKISDAFSKLGNVFKNLSFKKVSDEIEVSAAGVTRLDRQLSESSLEDSAIAINESSNIISSALEKISGAFNTEKLTDSYNSFKGMMSEIISWLKDKLVPFFQNLSVGGIVSAGAGFGFLKIVSAIVNEIKAVGDILHNVSKLIGNLSKTVAKLPKVLNSFSKVLNAYANNENATAMIKYAVAIGILAVSLRALAEVPWQQLAAAGATIGGVALALAGALKLSKSKSSGKKGIETLFDLIDSIAGKVTGVVNTIAQGVKKKLVAEAVEKLTISVALIVGAIVVIAEEYKRNGDNMGKALAVIGVISGVIVGILGFFTFLDKKKNQLDKGTAATTSMKKAASAVLMLSASLLLIVQSVKQLLGVSLPNDWLPKIGIFTVLIGEMTLVAIALNKFGSDSKSASTTPLLMLTLSLRVAVDALIALFKTTLPDNWHEYLFVLTAVLGELVIFATILHQNGSSFGKAAGVVPTIISLCALLATAVGALTILTKLPLSGIAQGTIALGAILGMLAKTFESIGKITNKGTWATVLAMAVETGTIAISLGVLSMCDWKGLIVAALAMDSVLLSLGKTFEGVSKISNPSAYILVGEMIAAVGVVALGLYEVSKHPWDSILAAAGGISAVLLIMSTCIGIINKIPYNPASMVVLIEALAAMGLAAVAIYKLAQYPWQSLLAAGTAISEVLLAMSAAMGVCTAVGAFAPAAIAGIGLLDLFIANFIAMLLTLGKVFENEALKLLLGGGASILAQIGEAIGGFIGGIIANGLRAVTSEMVNMGSDLSAFANNAKDFIDLMSNGVGQEAITGVKNLCKMVIEITKAEMISGIQSWVSGIFGGSGGIVQFGEQIKSFGQAMADFGNIVAGINMTHVNGAIAAAMMMSQLANTLPDTGGLKQKIFGEVSISKFGDELVKFGPSIVDFATTVKGVNGSMVEGAASAAGIMSELAKNLPKTSSLKDKIFGSGSTKSLSQFGKELVLFGPELKAFAVVVQNVSGSMVQGASSAAEIMSNLAKTLPSNASLKDKIFGSGSTKSLSQFGKELEKFGPSIAAYANSVKGIQATDISKTIDSIKNLVILAKDMEHVSIDGLQGFTKGLKKMGQDGIDAFIRAFSDSYTKAINTINKFIQNVVDGIKIDTAKLSKKGAQMTASIVDGIETSANSSFKKVNASMQSHGGMVADGVVQGITKKVKEVKQAGAMLGNYVAKGFDESLEIHSPSRRGERDAMQFGEGVIVGTEQIAQYVERASGWLGDLVGNSFKKHLSDSVDVDYIYSTYAGATSQIMGVGENALQMAKKMVGESVSLANERSSIKDKLKETYDFEAAATQAANKSRSSSAKETKQIEEEIITDENRYWAELLAVKRKGAEAEKYESMKVKDFMTEVLEQTQQALDNYTSQLESTREAIFNQISLFDEVGEQEEKSSKVIVGNLKGQIWAYEQYVETISSLDQRLSDRELGAYLKTLGVNNLYQLQEINRMSDSQLQEYADLYDTKMGLANQAAEIQLGGLKSTTERELSEIYGSMYNSVDLDQLTTLYDGTIQSLNNYVLNVLTPMNEAITLASHTVDAIGSEVGSGVTAAITGLEESMKEPLQQVFSSIQTGGQTTAKEAGINIGGFIGEGVVEGLQVDPHTVVLAADQAINSVVEALREAGQIHSPSELTETKVGLPLAEGITAGMTSDEANAEYTTGTSTVLEKIVTLFEEAKETLDPIGTTIVDSIVESIKKKSEDLQSSGQNMIDSFMTGFNSKSETVSSSATSVVDALLKPLSTRYSEFTTNGTNSIDAYLQPFKNQVQPATELGTTISNNILQALKDRIKPIGDAGKESISGYIKAFNDKKKTLSDLIKEMAEGVKNQFKNQVTPITDAGKDSIKNYKKAFEDQKEPLNELIQSMVDKILKIMEDAVSTFTTRGSDSMTAYKTPFETGAQPLVDLVGTMVDNILTTMDKADKAYELGEDVGSGYASGIRSKVDEVARAAQALANATSGTVEDDLEIESPSKKMRRIANFAGIGYLNGLMPYAAKAAKASSEIADETLRGMSKVNDLSNLFDSFSNPVIRPEFDLSSAQNFVSYLNQELSKSIGVSANLASNVSASNQRREESTYNVTSPSKPSTGREVIDVTFTQNNYSPKALSAIDIYRQTKNQMSVMKARLDKI